MENKDANKINSKDLKLEFDLKKDKRSIQQQLFAFGYIIDNKKALEFEGIRKQNNLYCPKKILCFYRFKDNDKFIYKSGIESLNFLITKELQKQAERFISQYPNIKLESWQTLLSEKDKITYIHPEHMAYHFKLGKNCQSIKKQLKSQGLKIKGKKINNMANVLYAIQHFIKKGEKDKQERYDSQYALLITEINKKIDKAIHKQQQQ